MITLLDCAVLAEDVYSQEHNNLARKHNWVRLDGQSWPDGFAAGVYEKDNQRVIAYRGTDDIDDAISDARMVPLAEAQRVQEVTPAILRAYGLHGNMELSAGAHVLGRLLNDRRSRATIALLANRVPPTQTRLALDYFDQISPKPRFLVGHSLGGALAKVISQRKNTPAIGFNSPFMGDLHGMQPNSSPNILSVNTIGDPLSLATMTAGNLSHGHKVDVRIQRFPRRPPQRPAMPAYTRPVSCPRASGAWYTQPDGAMQVVASNLCEAAMEAWEPIGRALTTPQRGFQMLQQYPDYYAALFGHLKEAALHHHSMVNLRKAIQVDQRFQQSLQNNFRSI